MKRIIVILALLAVPVSAHAAERIVDYRSTLRVGTDSTLRVQEAIRYDFGDIPKHGIYRDIPKQSEDGPRIVVDDVSVTADDQPAQFLIENGSDSIRIRIGDPDATVTGAHYYTISYTVHNEIRYFDDRDELYWNAIPQNFPVPIDAAGAFIEMPPGAQLVGIPACYTGEEGSQQSLCALTLTDDGAKFTTVQPLSAFEGMTVVMAIKPGVIVRAAPITEDLGSGTAALVLFVVVIVGIGGTIAAIIMMAAFNRLSLPKKRRDGGTIIVQYDAPAGVTPAQAGYLASNGSDKNSITAGVVQLAIDGWLKLEFTESKKFLFTSRDIIFHRRRDTLPDDPFAARILAVFAPTMEPTKLSDIKSEARKHGTQLHPAVATIRTELLASGILEKHGPFGVFSRPTAAGRVAMEHLAGLKIYIAAAEKERLAFHNAPERSPQMFEKLLPYAIALGVDEPWRNAFADVMNDTPAWAEGNVGGMAGVMAGVGHLTTDVQSVVGAYSSGSGGGGSSGGGGGGGGGGSW